MVSKRKFTTEDEPGPSKKRARAENKVKPEGVSSSSSKTKRIRKSKSKEVEPEPLQEYEVEKEGICEEKLEPVKKKPEPVSTNSDMPNWPIEHMSELLRRIENALPQRDNLLYKSRVDRLNWNEIAFGDYSGAECRLMWSAIQKRLRRFRLMRELVDDAKSWITKPWTDFYKGNKTNRHPDMPRRPLSTYMIFYMNKKDKVLKDHPGLEMTGLSKFIAEMYNKLSPKAKEKYNEMAATQRKEYEEKLEEFNRLHPEFVTINSKTNSSNPNDHLPKKPPTPFKLFCEDKLKQCKHESDFEKNAFVDKCKEQWRTMSDKKKVCWINWALDRETKYQDEMKLVEKGENAVESGHVLTMKYNDALKTINGSVHASMKDKIYKVEEDMKKYVAENPDYIPTTAKSILTKEERTIKERMAGKPEKPPTSAYSLFSRLMLTSKDVKNVSPKERMLLIAQQWKNCSDVEKKEYNLRVKHMLEQYKLQYAEYLESLSEDKRQEELLNNQPKKKTKIVKPSKQVATGSELYTAKAAVKTKKGRPTKKVADKVEIAKTTKSNTLYEGEPEPPPATPYLLFFKSYQSSYPEKKDAHEAWERMNNEQKNIHRTLLQDLKNVYIESYENFLKGLTQEQLKDYSEWKKTVKLTNQDSDNDSDDSESDSDEECSSNSDSNSEVKGDLKTRQDGGNSSSSE